MNIDENIAGLSNGLLYSAMTAYLGSMISYALDLADGGKEIRSAGARREAVVAAGGAPVLTKVRPEAPRAAAAPQPSARRCSSWPPCCTSGPSSPAASRCTGCPGATCTSSRSRAPASWRWPTSSRSCAPTAPAWAAVGDARYLGVFVTAPVLATLGIALRTFYVDAAELVRRWTATG